MVTFVLKKSDIHCNKFQLGTTLNIEEGYRNEKLWRSLQCNDKEKSNSQSRTIYNLVLIGD